MLKNRIFFALLVLVLFVLIIKGALFIFIKKIKKIPTLKPIAETISEFDNEGYFLNKKNIVFVDFENYEKNEELNDTESYSGKYSYKVFGKNSFSAVISKAVGEMGIGNFEQVGFSAYVYVFDDNFKALKADLVFSVADNNDKNIVWHGVTLSSEFMTPHTWTKINGSVNIDTSILKSDYQIKVYLWNDSKTNILIDDILVIAGKDEPRKGDTVLCDMSDITFWKSTFNMPPFNTFYFEKENLKSNTATCLTINNSDSVFVFPHTKIVTGNFYNTKNLLDKIIIAQNKELRAYGYCETKKAFNYDYTIALAHDNLEKSLLLSAPFTGRINDEIIVVDTLVSEIMLLSFKDIGKASCGDKPQDMSYEILWNGSFEDFGLSGKKISCFSTPCFSAPEKSNLMVVYTDGHWQIFEFVNKKWELLGQSQKPVEHWIANNFINSFTEGLQYNKQKFLLNVSTALKASQTIYTFYAFDKSKKQLFPEKSFKSSSVWGLDTLKADDVLIPYNVNNNAFLLRHNNSWRNDLKNLVFNDTTYQILGNIDFKGYRYDHNPKFYENLKFIPGKFIHKDITSFITLCYNGKNNEQFKNYEFLPNALHIFTSKPLKSIHK